MAKEKDEIKKDEADMEGVDKKEIDDKISNTTDKANDLERKLLELEERVAELTAGWQRTQADFVNYKKQTEQDRIKLIKTANADLIEAVLPVLDNFAIAAKHLPKELENNNWAIGIKQIEKQLETVLANEGLERIESIGQHFDPNLHEAIDEVESDQSEGTIVEEIAPGYIFHGVVLRPARVKVSKSNN